MKQLGIGGWAFSPKRGVSSPTVALVPDGRRGNEAWLPAPNRRLSLPPAPEGREPFARTTLHATRGRALS